MNDTATLAQILITFGGLFLLDLLPDFTEQWFPVLTDIALAMSLGEVIMTAALVFSVLWLFGVAIEIALLLAAIAPATAPAATVDVVHEYQAKGKFTDTSQGIVAIDDAWGLLVFSLLLAIAQALSSQGEVLQIIQSGSRELGGVILPVVLGSAVIFELIGPVATRWTLPHVGDIPDKHEPGKVRQ